MRDRVYDVIVVGGGMAGAHASWPLVEAGKDVLMLDGGVLPASPAYDVSEKDFESMRREDEGQHRLFLGDEFGGMIAASSTSHSSMMTSGNRSYISEHTPMHLPLGLRDVHIIQSLAKGGLSEAWGSVCAVFNTCELEHAGIPSSDMHAHYQEVINRIGISGIEPGYETQPPARITMSMQKLFARYQKLPPKKRGDFELKPALLALLTERLGEREPVSYKDLDFYMVNERAIYRARYTIEEMERHENFHYLPGKIVDCVRGMGNVHEVVARDFSGSSTSLFHARRVILAAGAINSNRLMLQSYKNLPPADLLLKPNYTMACIDPRLIGESGERKRYSLCQLVLDLPGPSGESALYANLYNYRSLMLWRLLQYAPLPAPESFAILARIAPSIVLVDVRFPGSEGLCEMALGERGLAIRQKQRGTAYKHYLPELKRFLRFLGVIPLHTAHLPLGASAHYAGGIRALPSGEMESLPGLYVADASAWRALPAKSTALTIMANANRVGTEVVRSF